MTEIAFIGAGRMASAIVHGLLKHRTHRPESLACTCGDDPSGPELAASTGIAYVPDIRPAARDARVVVLACKPQQVRDLPDGLEEATEGKLILSILAGVPLKRLGERFPNAANIVRAMPNTPGRIGAGVTAYAPLHPLDPDQDGSVRAILAALGKSVELEESQLDAVTALSGSGPAYLFELAAAMRDAGVELGLPEATAEMLAIETILGAGNLMACSDEGPEALRDAVTSAGGTTAAALEAFAAHDLRGAVRAAMRAARDRSLELAGS